VRVLRRRGHLTLRLERVEVSLLLSLLDQLENVLDGEDGDGADGIRERLSPAGYPDDREAEREFRELTAQTLRADRDQRIGACRADLGAGGDVDLTDPDAARRWIQVLNDLRLAFGTRLGVSEEDEPTLDPDAEDAELRTVYHWLTAVQDSVVVELMG
jgi:Domain of unknown function (DUF2017)